MPSEAAPKGAGTERRLPRVALLFALLQSLRTYLLPLLALLVFSRGDGYETWLAVFLLPSLGFALFKYLTFSYRFGEDELVVRSGFLFRQERHIPYARIQNVDLRQNPLHRLAKVAVARIETGSGGEAEAEISVLTEAAIAELKAAVFRRTGAPEHGPDVEAAAAEARPAAAAAPLVAVTPGDLVLRGLLTGRGWVILAAGLGFAHQFGVFGGGRGGDWTPFGKNPAGRESWPSWEVGTGFATFLGAHYLVAGAIFLVTLLAATRLLSVLWTLITFWGFRLSRRGDDLTTEQGLFTRVSATLPRHRIQALELRAGWLDRLCGRAALLAATAGRGLARESQAENPAAESAELFLAPILPRPEAEKLLRELAPEFFTEELEWQGFAPGTFARLLRLRLLQLSPLAGLAFFFPLLWLPLAAGIALSAFLLRRYVTRSGWALGRQAIFWRSGRFGEVFKVVPLEKIQVVVRHSSPFDRRRGTATVLVDTAATDLTQPTLTLPYLAAGAAEALAERLASESGRRSFRW